MTSVQEFTCIFCNETFDDKQTLQIHFRKHGDPKFDQTAKAKVRSQNDSPMSTDSSKDDNEMVSCDVCSEVFPTISKAITHKHKVHPDHDAKYFCPWCGKLFTLKHLYNKHLQSTHSSPDAEITDCFHCDCCDVDFFIPSAMVYHNRFFHRQDTELPAIGHSKKVKLLSQELVQIYYCPFCGEEYNNKVNLHNHMTDDHSDENQSPEDILRCPLCEAIFYHLDAYELHLTFHSSEDLYSEENEMLKQIIEFSLDTVPPLMEKVEIPAVSEETEELNTIGIDQFLQLTMNKDPEEEPTVYTDKIKSKKHKKHKKSKKTITLDEFLNMNSDVFGEDLNFQGIEEIPTRVVKKQLKPKKEQVIKNHDKKLMSSSDIDKLKKQGITVKMKPGSKSLPSKINELPSTSLTNKSKPAKSNVISTSSEVLSKLMSQGNSQIKIVKKAALISPNIEQNFNEKNNTKELTNLSQDNKVISVGKIISDSTKSKGMDKVLDDKNPFCETESDENAKDENIEVITKDIKEISPSPAFVASNTLPRKYTTETTYLNESLDSNNIICNTMKDSQEDINHGNNFNIENRDVTTNMENSKLEVVHKTDQQVPIKPAVKTLNDFEEDLASSKILRTNLSDNSNIESHYNENNEKKVTKDVIEPSQDATKDTLNAIKHLSHLITVKSTNQSKLAPSGKEDDTGGSNQIKDSQNQLDKEKFKENIREESLVAISKSGDQKESATNTMDALKNIRKHLTIKSLKSQMSSPRSVTEKSSDESDYDDEECMDDICTENSESTCTSSTKNIVGRKVVNLRNQNKPGTSTNSLQMVSPPHGTMKKIMIKKPSDYESPFDTQDEGNKKNISNADLLKRLTNVTAKPLQSKNHIKQEHSVHTSFQLENTKKGKNTNMITKQEKIDKEIEIFNIDDSDSDGQDKQDENTKEATSKLSMNYAHNKTYNVSSVSNSHEALRNLSKNITVKSNNQLSINQSIFKGEETFSEQNNASFTDENDDSGPYDKKINHVMNQYMNQCNKNLKSTLKNLSKHLIVKSRNSSPNLSSKMQQDKNIQNKERIYGNDNGSDSDSNVGKVKISEITDNNASDHEFLSDVDESKDERNFFVQSPSATNSDFEDNCNEEENQNQISNYDNQSHLTEIKTKTFEKPYQSPTSILQSAESKSPISNFKKFNKEITIKSFKEKKMTKDMGPEMASTTKDNLDIPNNSNKDLSVKQFRPNATKRNIKPENQAISSNLALINEKVGNAPSQVNTVNKEVSVKTFQTQTVIEEITTTVTKTIRTVNQTVQQEVKNINQSSTNATFKPQKIVNYNQQGQKSQNIIVRHPSPSIGTKIKNVSTTVKPVISTGIRPSNQLVPVRPGLSLSKSCNPTMPVIKNVAPSKPTHAKPVTGRTLKISPQAMNQSMKRPPDEITGQFSCFKKPKESFPMEVPSFRGDQDGEATMHFSSSQSRSDFSSTVKNIKGKSVVTSTQMKSEMNTSSHLSKLGNMSGLKVVKTSSKQATQVEERIEDCGAKRTMEALQKLQMQGLLVKRPRTDCNEDNEFSNSGSDEDEGYEN